MPAMYRCNLVTCVDDVSSVCVCWRCSCTLCVDDIVVVSITCVDDVPAILAVCTGGHAWTSRAAEDTDVPGHEHLGSHHDGHG